MIKLRDYQQEGVDALKQAFKNRKKHLILQAPTGAGKTIIFSYMAQKAAAKGKIILILTDRTELLNQTGNSLISFGSDPYFIRSGTKYLNFKKKVYVAMCQTLRNRIKKPIWSNWIKDKVDLVIIDEAHKQDFNYLFESGLIDDIRTIGFTATPRRSGKARQLALDYEEIIPTITVKDLIDKEYLVNDDYFGVSGVNLNDIKFDRMKGDYSEKDMFSRFNAPKLYAGVVKNWLDVSPNTHTIVFCVNIEHVIHTCEEFQKNGIDARFLVSKMGTPKAPGEVAKEGEWTRYEEKMRLYNLYQEKYGMWSGGRTEIINKFKRKEFPVLVNAGILTAGFDCPEIETVVVNRATTSATLWLQMIGRGSRPALGKTHFNILDFGDNASRLGHYTLTQHWSLWHDNNNTGEGVPPVKDCGGDTDKNGKKGCNRLIMASTKICPFCGYIYPTKELKEIDLNGVLYDSKTHTAVPTKKINEMSNEELYLYWKNKGHKPPWFWRQLYFRGGADLIEEFGKSKGWKKGTIEKAVAYIKKL